MKSKKQKRKKEARFVNQGLRGLSLQDSSGKSTLKQFSKLRGIRISDRLKKYV